MTGHNAVAVPDDGCNHIQRNSRINAEGDERVTEAVQTITIGPEYTVLEAFVSSDGQPGRAVDDLADVFLDPVRVVGKAVRD